MLYVEAPAGVGFSFSDDQADYTTGDAKTAKDNLLAIQQFFLRFPDLSKNDFYISAESYGGQTLSFQMQQQCSAFVKRERVFAARNSARVCLTVFAFPPILCCSLFRPLRAYACSGDRRLQVSV